MTFTLQSYDHKKLIRFVRAWRASRRGITDTQRLYEYVRWSAVPGLDSQARVGTYGQLLEVLRAGVRPELGALLRLAEERGRLVIADVALGRKALSLGAPDLVIDREPLGDFGPLAPLQAWLDHAAVKRMIAVAVTDPMAGFCRRCQQQRWLVRVTTNGIVAADSFADFEREVLPE